MSAIKIKNCNRCDGEIFWKDGIKRPFDYNEYVDYEDAREHVCAGYSSGGSSKSIEQESTGIKIKPCNNSGCPEEIYWSEELGTYAQVIPGKTPGVNPVRHKCAYYKKTGASDNDIKVVKNPGTTTSKIETHTTSGGQTLDLKRIVTLMTEQARTMDNVTECLNSMLAILGQIKDSMENNELQTRRQTNLLEKIWVTQPVSKSADMDARAKQLENDQQTANEIVSKIKNIEESDDNGEAAESY